MFTLSTLTKFCLSDTYCRRTVYAIAYAFIWFPETNDVDMKLIATYYHLLTRSVLSINLK